MIGAHRYLPIVLLIGGLMGVAGFVGWQAGVDSTTAEWESKWDQQALQLAQAQAHALDVARTEEQRRIKAIEDITNESKKQIEQARADAAAADAVADSLHEQARRLAARNSQCTSRATTTDRGEAARATDATVLADLFARADAAAGRLAAAYDRARTAGLACERAYDALRNASTVP